MPRPLLVTHMRHPHELLLLVVSITVGLAYLVGAPAPTSVAALLPRWQVQAWAVALLASGVIGVAGTSWRRYDTGLILEGGAMLIGSGGATLYAVCVIAVNGWQALLASATVAAWAAANLWRLHQIRAALRELA